MSEPSAAAGLSRFLPNKPYEFNTKRAADECEMSNFQFQKEFPHSLKLRGIEASNYWTRMLSRIWDSVISDKRHAEKCMFYTVALCTMNAMVFDMGVTHTPPAGPHLHMRCLSMIFSSGVADYPGNLKREQHHVFMFIHPSLVLKFFFEFCLELFI